MKDITTGVILPAVQINNLKTKVQNLLHLTDSSFPDFGELETVIAMIDHITEDVSQMFKLAENKNKIFQIQSTWYGMKDSLAVSDRYFVRKFYILSEMIFFR
jgi:hypothetical protein